MTQVPSADTEPTSTRTCLRSPAKHVFLLTVIHAGRDTRSRSLVPERTRRKSLGPYTRSTCSRRSLSQYTECKLPRAEVGSTNPTLEN